MTPHVLNAALLAALAATATAAVAAEPARVPVVYCTDLFHPHDDADDHLDLATLFALPELDVKGVVLDQGAVQRERPGRVALEQMVRLTGRRVPYAVGLTPLNSPTDTGRGQPTEYQAGVELILSVLRASDRPVAVITAGSVRDVVAAFHREPGLLKAKVAGLYVNIGNSAVGGDEWNVGLDRHAYRALFASGLPVWWFPCFPADAAASTYFRFTDFPEALHAAPAGLRRFFVYAMLRLDPAAHDPLAALDADPGDPDRVLAGAPSFRGGKEMWCTPSFLAAAGRTCVRVDGRVVFAPAGAAPPGAQPVAAYEFVPARVAFDDQGKPTAVELGATGSNLKVIRRPDVPRYARAMNEGLADLLARFPAKPGR